MVISSHTETPSSTIVITPEWSHAVEAISRCPVLSTPVTVVCGPKNCGKNTFCRHLVNVLLQRHKKVAYLDTDVGQTEFTPPGLLSLNVIDKIILDLTVPCSKTPERCFFFGDISSKRDPKTYLACICTLYNHYLKEYSINNETKSQSDTCLPLVINTPGWVKGIGYEILVDMLKYVSPTHVVKIRISVNSKNLPAGAFWTNGENADSATIIDINAALQDHLNRSVLVKKDAHQLRDLRVIAYFRQCFPKNMNISTIKELSRALADHAPYEVSISSITIKHLHCLVPRSEAFYSLNATIIGLAVSSEVPGQLPLCVGLGIVRGIDLSNNVLYIITPVPQSTLEDVDLLLQGFIQIPTCLLQVNWSLRQSFIQFLMKTFKWPLYLVQGCVSPYMASNVLSVS